MQLSSNVYRRKASLIACTPTAPFRWGVVAIDVLLWTVHGSGQSRLCYFQFMSSFTSWSQLCSHRMMERPWTVPLTGLTAVRLQPAKINTSIIRFGERAASKTLFWETVVGSPCVTSNFLLSASAKHASSLKQQYAMCFKKRQKNIRTITADSPF